MTRRDELAIGVAAGVDYRLVRRVYQGAQNVHPALAAAVRAAAEKLGYPSPDAARPASPEANGELAKRRPTPAKRRRRFNEHER
jgi:hypothetical protein